MSTHQIICGQVWRPRNKAERAAGRYVVITYAPLSYTDWVGYTSFNPQAGTRRQGHCRAADFHTRFDLDTPEEP